MKKRHKRLAFVGVGLAGVAIVATLVFQAFSSNMMFFFSPSDVVADKAPVERKFRLGGLVEEGTVQRDSDGLTVRFQVTDNAHSIPVAYKGILPDLFREGQGVVTQGKLNSAGLFVADEVLAKHDENYMPPEVAEALEKAKQQQPGAMKTAADEGGVAR